MRGILHKTIDSTVLVAYSGKVLGDTSGNFSNPVIAKTKRQKIIDFFDGKIGYTIPIVGGDNIVNIDNLSPIQLKKLDADALITSKKGVVIIALVADCIPLVLYNKSQPLLAVAHVGLGGAALHLPSKLIKQLAIIPSNLACYIGPSIKKSSYKHNNIQKKQLDSSWSKYITEKDGFFYIDILGYTIDELKHAGISKENIKISPIDTGSDLNYYSHRRHKLTGEPDGRNGFAASLI